MMHLFDVLAFPRKKIRIISGFLIGYISWVLYLSYQLTIFGEDRINTLVFYDKLTHQMIFSIIPFLMGWLWIDLINAHDRVLVTMHYRYYLWDMKWLYVFLISGLYLTFFYLIYWMIPLVWVPYLTFSIDVLKPVHLWLDVMILYLFSHLMFSEKTRTLSLIFPLVYLIFQLLMQEQSSRIIYLILPLYQEEIVHFSLALPYKLWYIGLGFILTRVFYGKIARYG